MKKEERYNLLRSLIWDYNIPVDDIDDVLTGRKPNAGHYNQHSLFIKILETYPWFTIIQLYSVEEIKLMLTDDAIKKLRMPSLRKKYEFVKKRLYQIIPATR